LRERIDHILVKRGVFDSRAKARAAIEAGQVRADGVVIRKPAVAIAPDALIEAEPAFRFVGRGALKLDHALSLWPIRVEGRVVLDIGASTGGFSEVCLERGAARVFAVDVGQGQLHPRISMHPRVVDLEKTDARELTADLIDEPPDLIVCDASFISLTKVLPVALGLAAPGCDLVTLVKPQFEMDSRSEVGRGGVVRDAMAREAALARVMGWLDGTGWDVRQTEQSPISGGDGNIEALLWATRRASQGGVGTP
jgi:23S rRNA (cytidine1920-2'-O)/16S rRNA (cytidine1409-2'-O)-methyltransferase